MRLIDADGFAAHLGKWRDRLAAAGECGGCAAELMETVARSLDGWPEVEGGNPLQVTGNPSVSLTADTSLCTRAAWGDEWMDADTQPPSREDADAQGCVLAWDAHGSGWVVRHYKNLQGARWWMRLPGAPE